VPPLVDIRGLEHAYPLEDGGQVAALRGIDLTVDRGEFVALIGPNGSGKSTLVRHLNGLLPPTAGEVRVDGLVTTDPQHLWEIRQRVGMVFQNPDNQIVAATVEEDVAFGPENLALAPDEIRRRVDEALATVGLDSYRTHPPHMLSGGQKQLLAIAGALASRATCLALDEPTAMLDPTGCRRVMDTLHRLNVEEGVTIIMITQSMSEATGVQRVVVMDAGRIALDGPPASIFAHADQLRAIGLDLPPAIEIAHRLRDRGIPLPLDLLTTQDLARALCTS
jgi:energy-coupling factor transport system ATP-binding protein